MEIASEAAVVATSSSKSVAILPAQKITMTNSKGLRSRKKDVSAEARATAAAKRATAAATAAAVAAVVDAIDADNVLPAKTPSPVDNAKFIDVESTDGKVEGKATAIDSMNGLDIVSDAEILVKELLTTWEGRNKTVATGKSITDLMGADLNPWLRFTRYRITEKGRRT